MSRPHSEDLLFDSSPESIGPFRVLHEIGAGALGPVFRTHQAGRDRLVAVKVFTLDLSPDQVAAFERELQRIVHAKLEHPSVVRAFAAGTQGGFAYLAQEYVPADALEVAVRQLGPLPIEDVLRIMTELSGAIDVAAASDISHGHLHLRDILVTNGDARLTGLGVARALDRVGFACPVARAYASPERATHGEWGRAADVYSLAAIACELLFGRRLDGAPEDAARVLRETAGVGSSLVEVLSTALNATPDRRYDTAAAFARELNRAATHPPRSAVPAPSRPAFDADAGAPVQHVESPAPGWARRDPVEETLALAAPEPVDEFGGALFDLYGEGDAEIAIPDAPLEEPVPVDAAMIGAPAEQEPRSTPPTRTKSAQPTFWAPHAGGPASDRSRGTIWPVVAAGATLLLIVGTGAYFVLRSGPGGAGDSGTGGGRDWTEARVSGGASSRPGAAQESPRIIDQSTRAAASPPTQPRAAQGAGSSRPAEAVSASGRLLIRSSPDGAVVMVNGERKGTTPLVLRDLSLGSYDVRLTRSGYAPVEQQVTLTAGEPSGSLVLTLANLEPSRAQAASDNRSAFGSLAALSRPSGATVYLDGRAIGSTPVVVAEVGAGSHEVRIERAGHRRWVTTVEVKAGERTRVAASLERGGME